MYGLRHHRRWNLVGAALLQEVQGNSGFNWLFLPLVSGGVDVVTKSLQRGLTKHAASRYLVEQDFDDEIGTDDVKTCRCGRRNGVLTTWAELNSRGQSRDICVPARRGAAVLSY